MPAPTPPACRKWGGNAAAYFNPHDPRDIAHTLIHLLQHDAERNGRGQEGLEQAAQFTWTQTAKNTRFIPQIRPILNNPCRLF
ncbi:MAG: hypothetical protein M5U34_11455 [Chloroflexi bacterium]|nr:hypothetical protein [Chloroflexota bacterium]